MLGDAPRRRSRLPVTQALREHERRTRHLLARVQAIVARMAQDDAAAEDFAAHLQGRLAAMMRGEAAAMGATDVDLEMILRDELLACAAPEAQVEMDGPAVRLRGRAAEVLTLAFHELATNSVKFGALTLPTGRIEIAWRPEHGNSGAQVGLTWTESGVPIVSVAPRHEGFGYELLTRRIPYELGGSGEFSLRPGGLRCAITFPLDRAVS